MEINTNAVQILEQHYQNHDFSSLARSAKDAIEKAPELSVAWRYLGIATLLSGGDGMMQLLRAAALGDADAHDWITVIHDFSYHPKGSIARDDIINQVKVSKIRRSPYMEFPLEVHIETLAVCNAKCNFCPHIKLERRRERMSDALINRIIAGLKSIPSSLPFTIAPFKVNDPFLDKRIFSICNSINTNLPNAALRLFTNGTPLTDKIIEKIAKLRNVHHLWISLNEADKAAYEATMQLPFDRTIKKLDSLHQSVMLGFPHQVVVSRVADGSRGDQLFREFVGRRYPFFKYFLIKRENWAGQIEDGGNRHIPPTACARWYELSIMANGKVALCCMDGEGKHVIGDANTQSILEIYNNPKYRKLRQFSVSRLAAAVPCNECDCPG